MGALHPGPNVDRPVPTVATRGSVLRGRGCGSRRTPAAQVDASGRLRLSPALRLRPERQPAWRPCEEPARSARGCRGEPVGPPRGGGRHAAEPAHERRHARGGRRAVRRGGGRSALERTRASGGRSALAGCPQPGRALLRAHGKQRQACWRRQGARHAGAGVLRRDVSASLRRDRGRGHTQQEGLRHLPGGHAAVLWRRHRGSARRPNAATRARDLWIHGHGGQRQLQETHHQPGRNSRLASQAGRFCAGGRGRPGIHQGGGDTHAACLALPGLCARAAQTCAAASSSQEAQEARGSRSRRHPRQGRRLPRRARRAQRRSREERVPAASARPRWRRHT